MHFDRTDRQRLRYGRRLASSVADFVFAFCALRSLIHVFFILGCIAHFPDAPLPLPQDGQETPQVKVRPQYIEKDDLRVLMALPEHEVGETTYAAGADEEVDRWVGGGVHV